MINKKLAKKSMNEMWDKHRLIDEMEAVEAKQYRKIMEELLSSEAKNDNERQFLIDSLYYLSKLIDLDFNEMHKLENQANSIYNKLYPNLIED